MEPAPPFSRAPLGETRQKPRIFAGAIVKGVIVDVVGSLAIAYVLGRFVWHL